MTLSLDPVTAERWRAVAAVDAARQRQGLGRTTVLALVDLLRGKGATGVALSCSPGNSAAARLYASLGFGEDGEADGETVARLAL